MIPFPKLIAATSIVLAAVGSMTVLTGVSSASAAPAQSRIQAVAAGHILPVSNRTPMRENPIAGAALAMAASCASSAAMSVGVSALQDMVNRGEPTEYVWNAVASCMVAGVVGPPAALAWRALAPAAQKKIVIAVIALIIRFPKG